MNDCITFWSVARSVFWVLGVFPLWHFAMRYFRKWLKHRAEENAHIAVLASNLLYYGGATLILIAVLHEFGFQLHTLLGAAGIAGVAVGFASQTTIENGISGVLLLLEQPFRVGDTIEVSGVTGRIENISVLSIKIRTAENNVVRIANAHLLKDRIVNKSLIPVERITFVIKINAAVNEDRFMEQVQKLADESDFSHKKHMPQLTMVGIEADMLTRQRLAVWEMHVWTLRKNIGAFQRDFMHGLKDLYGDTASRLLIAKK